MTEAQKARQVKWHMPVRIRVGVGIASVVRGPEEALHHLTYRWPAFIGRHYDIARRQCVAALQDQCPLDIVREAFIAASIEADMLDVDRSELPSNHGQIR